MAPPSLPRDHLKGTSGVNMTGFYSNSRTIDEGRGHLPQYQRDATGSVLNQCVAGARRYLFDQKALILPDIAVAAQIFYLPHVFEVDESADEVRKVPLFAYTNGQSQVAPQVGDFVIYRGRAENPVGHIAVVSGVTESTVGVVDQNRRNHAFTEHQQVFPLHRNSADGTFTIEDHEEPCLGWVTTNRPDKPLTPADPQNATPKMAPRELGEGWESTVRPWPKSRELLAQAVYTEEERSFAAREAWKSFYPHPAVLPMKIFNLFLVWPALVPLKIYFAM